MKVACTGLIVFYLLLFPVIPAKAQNSSQRLQFHSLNQIGLLQGESQTAVQLQTVNGWETNNFFVGIGLGLDYYKFKTIPLFLDLKKYFGKRESQFFLDAAAGLHFVWDQNIKQNYLTNTYQPGFYGDIGAGYRGKFKTGMAFLLGAGYSYKAIRQIQTEEYCLFGSPCYTKRDDYFYQLNRLTIKIGWQF